MRKIDILSMLLLSVMLSFPVAVSAADADIRINPAERRQTIEGWGTSLCWWANVIGRWDDEEKIDSLITLLTSPDYLNYNIFRYNIGGGDNPSHYTTATSAGHMTYGKGQRAEMDGFLDSVNGSYNWTRDPGQQCILKKLSEARNDAVFEAFSNSPPYWMTYSNCSAGNDSAALDNLKPEYYEAFADYLVTVCKHISDTSGITFKTLEPFNEANTNYWGAYGGQEGCHFDFSSQVALTRVLREKMLASGLKTVISSSDESIISSSISGLKSFLAADSVAAMVSQWNTHTYGGSNMERSNLRDIVINAADNKTLWMSETGSGGSGIGGNLSLMQRMFNDLTYMAPSAWLDWQFAENSDQWGVVKTSLGQSFDTSGNKLYATDMAIVKNFYVHMQVTRFIKRGYMLLTTGNGGVLSALSPNGDSLVIVALNNTSSSRSFLFDLSLFSSVGTSATQYLTSETYDCQKLSDITINSSSVSYTLDSYSVATLIVPVVAGDGIAGIQEDEPYWIQARAGTTVLKASCSGLTLEDAAATDKNEQWYIRTLTNGNYQIYVLDSVNTRYAITETSDYYLTMEIANDTSTSQQFTVDSVGDGCMFIVSVSSGKALDQESGSVLPAARVGIDDFTISDFDNARRQWRLVLAPTTSDKLVSSPICTGEIEEETAISGGYFILPWEGSVTCSSWTVPSGDPKVSVNKYMSGGDTLAVVFSGPQPVLILIGENTTLGVWKGWSYYPQAISTEGDVAYYLYSDIETGMETMNDGAEELCDTWSLSIINWASSCTEGDVDCVAKNTTTITSIYVLKNTATEAPSTAVKLVADTNMTIVDNVIYSEGNIKIISVTGQVVKVARDEANIKLLPAGTYFVVTKLGTTMIEKQ